MSKSSKKSGAAASPEADKAASSAKKSAAKSASRAPAEDADKSAAAEDAAAAGKSADGGGGGESRAAGGESESAAEKPASESAASPADYDAETLRDLYMRAVAEKENAAKRAATEIKKAHDFALSRFAPGVCEVRDCLESALAESEKSGEDGAAREGLNLALQKLGKAMEAGGVRPVRPDIGASFDANLHEAVGMSEGGEGARVVAKVMQCGYTLNGRLIRPAIVWLGKPPAASEGAAADGS